MSSGEKITERYATLGDGNFGGPYQSLDEVIQKTFDAAVESMVKLLKGL